MKVSFDYDGTLSTDTGKELLKKNIAEGNTVYLITARRPSNAIISIATGLGIPKRNIHFTSGKDKWQIVKILSIDKHYDNNKEQIDKINANTTAKGILINN